MATRYCFIVILSMDISPLLALTRPRYWYSNALKFIALIFLTSEAWCSRSIPNLVMILWENLGGKRKPFIRELWVSNSIAVEMMSNKTLWRMRSFSNMRKPECSKKESNNKPQTTIGGSGNNEGKESCMEHQFKWCMSTLACIFNIVKSPLSAIGNVNQWN